MNKLLLITVSILFCSLCNAEEFIENAYYKKISVLMELDAIHIPESEEKVLQHATQLKQELNAFINGSLPVSKLTAQHLNYAVSYFNDSELKSYLPLFPVSLFSDYKEFFPPLYTLHTFKRTQTLLTLWGNPENRNMFKTAGLNSVIFALGQCDTNRAIELASVEQAQANTEYENYLNNIGCP
jgi:hypothetical protein